jgi:hypothetical protein
MPPLVPDAPWWANALLVAAVLAVVPALTTWLTARPARRTLRRVAEDARTAAAQTANEHDDSPYPNLRDELTAIREGQESLRRTVALLAEAHESTRGDLGGLHSEVRDLRLDLGGVRADARRDRRDLADLRRQIPDPTPDPIHHQGAHR